MTNRRNLTVHFAHANGFPAASYSLLLDAIEPMARVLALDKFAHNPVFPLSRGWGNQVDELIHFLTENNGVPSYLVGHSFGAVVSYMAACLHPDKVKGLIMLDPPLFTGVTSAVVKVLRPTPLFDRLTPARQTLNRCTQWPKGTDLTAYFSGKQLFKNMHPTCIEDYTKAAVKETDEGFELDFDHTIEANIFRTIPLNISRFYGKLRVPAVLITGEKTTVCRPHLIAPFIKHNQLQHKTVKDGGHMFPLEQPLFVAEMIKQQLAAWEC
ncbi:alpha/beta hydrolase [Aliiglaciecola litoralis]|uniref:Alpha/beta hydrolase n=1 Tax=Aliiglaciecola litoralis TaxID=582857 RepID=A0ABP3WVH7_9ALTE